MEQVLFDLSIRHAGNMSKPAESALLEKDVEALDSSLGEDLGVCHAVRPPNAEDVPQISQIACVRPLFLSGVKSSRLGTIEKGAEDAGSTYGACMCGGVDDQLAVFPDSFDQTNKGRAARSMRRLVSVSRQRSFDTVEPRLICEFVPACVVIDCDFGLVFQTMAHNVSPF